MKDNISNILKRGNLTPKERVLLMVQNNIKKEREGKEILTEADKHALIEGWTPKDNNEVAEYNRFNNGWIKAGFAELEAQTIFLNAEINYYRTSHIGFSFLYYPAYKVMRESIKRLEQIKRVDINEANRIVKLQREQKLKDGIDFEFAVYLLAFELLREDYQKDLKTLYDEAPYEHQYLDQEEIIFNLFNGKDKLTKEAKEKLAKLVAERAYNPYAQKYQLSSYFAGIPTAEVARYFLFTKGVEVKGKELSQNQQTDDEQYKTHDTIQEATEQYAKDHKADIGEMIKEGCLKWLDDGLLIDAYSPLFNSKQKNTYNGDTKHPHDEVFKEWLKSKDQARATLNELVKKGELKVEPYKTDEPKIKDPLHLKKNIEMAGELMGIETATTDGNPDEAYQQSRRTADKFITGESLYNFKGDYKFIREQKNHIDKYEPDLGIVYEDGNKQHLDSELLISEMGKDGKPHFFSFSHLALEKLKRAFESTQMIKVSDQDGESILEVKDDRLAEGYKQTRKDLIKGYALLLSFKELFTRLSKTYEIDLTYKIDGWIETISGFIDLHNESLKLATGQAEQPSGYLSVGKWTARLKDDLFIDKDKIEPDDEHTKPYFTEFTKVLGGDF